jgi:hypothetical protein
MLGRLGEFASQQTLGCCLTSVGSDRIISARLYVVLSSRIASSEAAA